MNLTISELAHAVGRKEGFIRQHIYRKHLLTRKDGRNVSVELEEAMRWASERGLPFNLPVLTSVTTRATKDRTARMTVLVWHKPGVQPCNLFTLIRHRRRDALGPWAAEPNETWSSVDLDHDLRLFSFDASFERCRTLVDQILDSGKLEIDGLEIPYALQPVPRRHWAYRDERAFTDTSMRSPFSRHSAEIVEYWSFMAEPRERWLKILDSLQGKTLRDVQPHFSRLGFLLERHLERVGNLMIAGAEDTITCDLTARPHSKSLILHVDTSELLPETYRATVWAKHSDDEVLRREIPVVKKKTVFELTSDVDHIGFAIFRTTGGQCVDLWEAFLLMEVGMHMEIISGPTLNLHDPKKHLSHTVSPSGSISTIKVNYDQDSAKLDKEIRQQWIGRRVHEQEASARREGNFVRFEPDQFDEAVQYFMSLLRQDSDRVEPIYFADPYFMVRLKKFKWTQIYLDMFALDMFATATRNRPLRILCTQKENENAQPWWSNFPKQITAHISVRAFRKQNGLRGFHDRYLITPDREILITHSLNGWHKDGVTFARLPYHIYRAEAESLWSMDIGSKTTNLYVEEIA